MSRKMRQIAKKLCLLMLAVAMISWCAAYAEEKAKEYVPSQIIVD